MTYLKNKGIIIIMLVLTAVFQASCSASIHTTVNKVFEGTIYDLERDSEIMQSDIEVVRNMELLVTSWPVYLLINLVEDFIIIFTFSLLYWLAIKLDVKIETSGEKVSFGEITNILYYQIYILCAGHLLNGIYMLIMQQSADKDFVRLIGISEIVLLALMACFLFKNNYITKKYSLAATHLISGIIMAGGIAYFLQ